MQYQAPRGTYDILPEEQVYWHHIKKSAARTCRAYGYRHIDTPVFEDAGLFVRSIGEETDIVQKEMYTFEDRGGDLLTLRPEGTASVCRAYLEHGMHNLPQPVRLYYISPIFRYERPQKGRFRQHWQFGAESIGSSDPTVDAELIEMAWSFYANLGLKKLVLKLNSVGCPDCRSAYLTDLKNYYSQYADRLCPDCTRRAGKNPLRLLDCKNESCIPLTEQAPKIADFLCDECALHFEFLKKYLDILEIDYQLEHRLVRGLDYYTRTVFEIQPAEARGAQSAVGGGGRYDRLIEDIGGKPTPATGFGTGIERLILNLKKQGIVPADTTRPPVYIAFVGQAAKEQALQYASQIRKEKRETIISTDNRSLKAQMRQANTIGAAYTIIIGEEELKDSMVMLKDMSGGEQERLPFAEALNRIKGVRGR